MIQNESIINKVMAILKDEWILQWVF